MSDAEEFVGSSMLIRFGSEDKDVEEVLEDDGYEVEVEDGVSDRKNVINCKRHNSNSRLLPLLSSSAL